MQTILYLVRHGTTELNVELKYQGLTDVPLNALGLAQGRLLTEYFKDIPLDAGVTSPLMRARQTLDFMLGERKNSIPVIIEPELHEIDLGVLERRPVAEVGIIFPEFQEDYKQCPGRLKVPGGETSVQVYNRMRDTILRVARGHQGRTVAMASHGFAIQTWLNYASGIPAENMKEWGLDNVAVSRFTFDFPDGGGTEAPRITINYIGDTHHLPAEYRCNYDWEKLSHPAPLLLYHPNCERCRLAGNFLRRRGFAFQKRDILNEPLRREELAALMRRYKGPLENFAQDHSLNLKGLSLEEAAEALAGNAALVRHPMLVRQDALLTGYGKDGFKNFFAL